MLKNKLLLVVGFQHHGILIEGTNPPGQFHAAQQVDGNDRLVLASRIEKRVLYVLRRLIFHLLFSPLEPKTAKQPMPTKSSNQTATEKKQNFHPGRFTDTTTISRQPSNFNWRLCGCPVNFATLVRVPEDR
jgi:hypothetical protein